MLTHLHIENYTLIEKLDLDLNNGFSVISGETGAGKSILLGAIGLLTGDRADLSVIQTGKQRCTLEATFNIEEYDLEDLFNQEDLEYDPKECIIRRELSANGKSRAFINDSPATVSVLKKLGNRLIDIHSQHQNLLLGQEDFQLSVLDTMASRSDLYLSYTEAYNKWRQAVKNLESARTSFEEDRKNEDYLRFLVSELANFRPQSGEDEYLRQQCDMLEHAQDIKTSLMQGYGLLSEGDVPVTDTLRQVRNQISSIQSYFPQAEELVERLESCRIELQDIATSLESEGENIDYDPLRLEELQSRLNTLFSLEQKHHVDSSDSLIAVLNQMQEQLDAIDNCDEHLKHLQEEEHKAHKAVEDIAVKLTEVRTKTAKKVEKEIIAGLKTLGMPNVRFQVSITPTEEPTPKGMNKITFLFSANLGADMQNISQVASGGETARVMLSLKAILSGAMSLPTIVFDEIDTGVSGHIAEAMAKIMRNMGSQGRQVISITHLPQIAAMGRHHYKVWKEETNGITRSHITYLDSKQRINEIANMLSGSSVSQEALNNARALLGLQQ
ncbi:MAG: DNA repair protein RecN [Bacteroidaceae bacterium]|nr:DNA repair protein RecN [Bacteroidaceae bacterium]